MNINPSTSANGSAVVTGGTINNTVIGGATPAAATFTTVDAATFGTVSAWTPTDGSGAGLTFTQAAATAIKIGKLVFVSGRVTYPVTADTNGAVIGNLPYAAGVAGQPQYNSVGGVVTAGTAVKCQCDRGTTNLYFYSGTNVQATNVGQTAKVVDFSIVYQTP